MDTRSPGLCNYARTSIDVAARQLIGKGGFTRSDFDDIRAEITLYTLKQLPRHDPRKSARTTFITMVVRDGAKHVLRARFAEKREVERQAASLDRLCGKDEDGNDLTLLHLLDSDDAGIALGRHLRPRREAAMLQLDVQAIVSGLPADLQRCCDQIMKGHNVTELARECGVARSTFRVHFLAPIRRAFEAAGLRDWL